MDISKAIVFFYGSFMSPKVLRDQGLSREVGAMEVATLEGFDVVLSPNATLVPSTKGVVYGVLAELTVDEIDLLYSRGWLSDYKPISINAKKKDGQEVTASCYVAPLRQNASPKPDYVSLLVETAKSYCFPSWYVERLRKAGLNND
ncbi:MAG: gamma-glutamylcyclotransferase [archaeon]|nr:MAG: gamma-glutamylcyclotransferase [archaeon]